MSEKKNKQARKVIRKAIQQALVPDRRSVTRRLLREMKRRKIYEWPDVL